MSSHEGVALMSKDIEKSKVFQNLAISYENILSFWAHRVAVSITILSVSCDARATRVGVSSRKRKTKSKTAVGLFWRGIFISYPICQRRNDRGP